jgi:hypothetical protein
MLGDKAMCVQLHGDAAFTGQGVVMESLGLSEIFTFRRSLLISSRQAISRTILVVAASTW